VVLRGELLDLAGHPLGRLELFVNYDYLMQNIIKEGWMVAQMACLVNQEGQYLAHSSPAMSYLATWNLRNNNFIWEENRVSYHARKRRENYRVKGYW
jgi:hypothetical protein